MGGPLAATAVDGRRASVPAAGAGDRLRLVLVLIDHVLEGLVRDGGLDGRSAVQGNLMRMDGPGSVGQRGLLILAVPPDSRLIAPPARTSSVPTPQSGPR